MSGEDPNTEKFQTFSVVRQGENENFNYALCIYKHRRNKMGTDYLIIPYNIKKNESTNKKDDSVFTRECNVIMMNMATLMS